MKCGIEFINVERVFEYMKKIEAYNVTAGSCKRKGKRFDLEK